MIKEALVKELEDSIGICCNSQAIELVDLSFRYEGSKLILTVLADKTSGGITLGECALLNRKLGLLLEEKNIIDGDYTLEVSSPGLDRCLKSPKDFLRCLNKEAVFYLNDLIDGKCQWQGLIDKADESGVFINEGGRIIQIPLVKINKAKLVV